MNNIDLIKVGARRLSGLAATTVGLDYAFNRNNEDVMFQKNAFQDFLNSYKEQILGNPLYQKFNTQSESRFFDFSLIMKQAYEQGLKEGKSPYSLLNSSSDDFILKNIAEFIPSDEQLTDELLQSMGVNVPNRKLTSTVKKKLCIYSKVDLAQQK